VKAANLVLRFALEMSALAAVAYWGVTSYDGVVRWLVGLGAPMLVIAVWWSFLAPKRPVEVPKPARFGLELAVWAAGALALAAAARPAYGIAFAVVAVLSGALNYVWS
jgi:hypothetical protein